MALRIGIDLGGSKIEIIALAEDGQVLARRRTATPQGDYRATIGTIAALVEAVEVELHQRGSVGIGIPGTENGQGRIKNANSTCLIGQPLRRDLQTLLQREVRLANDANCFALSEAVDGAAAGARAVFGVILGTGVGGGLVLDGKVWAGANGIAGEWGHNALPNPEPADHPPPPCYCGRLGCVETYLSGPALQHDHAAHSGESPEYSLPAALAERAAAGDPAAEASLGRYEQRLAKSLAVVINILDPEVIVLGGGLSNLARLYANVPRLWAPYIFSDTIATRLLPNQHGDSSGVRGAAWLWGR